ncbi:MAG: mechanosensitive ion channel [Porphyromonas sp.]|nr:mechanosensitive ion channel [Porphyromonas sp.]
MYQGPLSLLSLPGIPVPDSPVTLQSMTEMGFPNVETLVGDWPEKIVNFGIKVVIALVVFYLGRLASSLILKWVSRAMRRRKVDEAVITFVHSFLSIAILVILLVASASILGVQSVSFAALLASAGVAIGMGLSGQLQNIAGGLIVLLSKPFGVGDHIITASGFEGKVEAVGIFYTVVRTFENRTIYIPNGKLTSNEITNVSQGDFLRNSWTIGIEYNEDFDRAKSVIEGIIASDGRIIPDPVPYVVLGELSSNSVNILVRAYSKPEDYWNVQWDFNREVYSEFNRIGIGFSFPQLTIHHAKESKIGVESQAQNGAEDKD